MLVDDDADGSYGQSSSTVALFAKSKGALAPFRDLKSASPLPQKGFRALTDDYSDILKPFLSRRGWFKQKEEEKASLTSVSP